MVSLLRPLAVALLAAPLLIGADAPGGVLNVEVSGLRSARGTLLLCLSANPRFFPDCGKDPGARTIKVPASRAAGLVFRDLEARDYALSVMHDENNNGRLDTTLGIPREGFGFSRNPVVRFGPPRFRDVRFAVSGGSSNLPVRMKYFL